MPEKVSLKRVKGSNTEVCSQKYCQGLWNLGVGPMRNRERKMIITVKNENTNVILMTSMFYFMSINIKKFGPIFLKPEKRQGWILYNISKLYGFSYLNFIRAKLTKTLESILGSTNINSQTTKYVLSTFIWEEIQMVTKE